MSKPDPGQRPDERVLKFRNNVCAVDLFYSFLLVSWQAGQDGATSGLHLFLVFTREVSALVVCIVLSSTQSILYLNTIIATHGSSACFVLFVTFVEPLPRQDPTAVHFF